MALAEAAEFSDVHRCRGWSCEFSVNQLLSIAGETWMKEALTSLDFWPRHWLDVFHHVGDSNKLTVCTLV